MRLRLFCYKCLVFVCCLILVESLSAQQNMFDPRLRGSNQNTAPSSFYMQQDVDVPSLREGQSQLVEPPKILETFESQEILIDRKVDPDHYVVGPGDVMGLYLWGDLDREFQNVVTPEGLLIITRVGEIKVAGLTLTQVYDVVKEKVHTKYHDIDVSVFLVRPRAFKVFISGLVLQPGLIGTNSLERVSEVINRAGLRYVKTATQVESFQNIEMGMYQDERYYNPERSVASIRGRELTNPYGVLETDMQIIKKGSSQRSIIIYREDETIEVDLLRFRKMGDLDWNPYVRMGDRIHVPQYIGDIILKGEVNNPDRYEFKPGDTVKDLLDYGGGLTVLSDTTNAILSRFEPDGKISVEKKIDLYDAVIHNPDDPKYILHESDRLYVYKKYEYKNLAFAIVDGQVQYPGEYPINPEKTTLSNLIKMAGGFTEYSNLTEAQFIRRMTGAAADQEYARLRQMSRSEMTEEEYDYLRSRSRMTQGKISLDFVKLFNDHDISGDLTLQHGDYIFVPFSRGFVQVAGAVPEPGNLKYEPGADYRYYIEQAGGFMWNSNTRKIRIINGKTGQRFKADDNITLEAGDIIQIPEKVPLDKWEFFRDTVLLFANIATIIILAQNITK